MMKNKRLIPVLLREQKRYTQNDLLKLFECTEAELVHLLRRLKEYGVLKAVKADEIQKSLSELEESDVVIENVEIGNADFYYVFVFVGVIVIENHVLECYPKYIQKNNNPVEELKQILAVLKKYNSKEQIIRIYNESTEAKSFNLLAVMLFLLEDYYEYGTYTNSQDIIEINGSGSILWDKTINETFTLISNNKPYYPELLTSKRINDDYDYFKRLHECILTKCSSELKSASLTKLFDIMEVDLSDEDIDDFGEKEYILYRLSKEINVQFNTRKQRLLKTIYTYIEHNGTLADTDCFSMFGTNSFNLVWEKVCAEILNNQLQKPLGTLKLPERLKKGYDAHSLLIDLIEKPLWTITGLHAKDTLIPDLISIYSDDKDSFFIIFDAKYYTAVLESGKPPKGQPGIESITKQYLYQLAYKNFISDHNFTIVRNCFLLPTEDDTVIAKGEVSLRMLDELKLEPIKVRLLPAKFVFEKYLSNKTISITELNL